MDWRSGKISRDAAVADIARRSLGFAAIFEHADHKSATA
jgi:hypothetical protein